MCVAETQAGEPRDMKTVQSSACAEPNNSQRINLAKFKVRGGEEQSASVEAIAHLLGEMDGQREGREFGLLFQSVPETNRELLSDVSLAKKYLITFSLIQDNNTEILFSYV